MKFGKTHEEKLQELVDSVKPKTWFAWRPVTLEDGRTVWLEKVIRSKDIWFNNRYKEITND